MTFPCNFDNGMCSLNCAVKGCTHVISDGICDKSCDYIECGFDFGDCAYCALNCTSTLYYNSICDQECNTPICNYDNFQCVIKI